jgi:hypothetical protein
LRALPEDLKMVNQSVRISKHIPVPDFFLFLKTYKYSPGNCYFIRQGKKRGRDGMENYLKNDNHKIRHLVYLQALRIP